jgi:hypothetical protein
MSRPVAHGSVLVHLPFEQVDGDFARDVEHGSDEGTVLQRVAPGRYASESRAGMARVLGEYVLEPQGAEATTVRATLWVQPGVLAVLARVVIGRRRMQRGVDAALDRMARKATGRPAFDEPSPEDFADGEPPGHLESDTPPD